MVEVDRIMIEDLNIRLHQMMENAGRNLADLAIRRFEPRTVVVLAGSGGNGGGGITAARHLANRGIDTRAIQHYLGLRNIQHTVRYTALASDRFNDFWTD